MLDQILHGKAELEWREDILVIIPRGPFNLEGVTNALAGIKSEVISAHMDRWGRLEILDKDAFGSPEVMASVRASYRWSLANGCIAIAIVSNNQVQRNLLTEDKLDAVRAFEDEDEAFEWLYHQMKTELLQNRILQKHAS